LKKTGDEMSEMNNTPGDSNDKYFLQEQELWENLGFDWEGWNAAVEKILQATELSKQSSRFALSCLHDCLVSLLTPYPGHIGDIAGRCRHHRQGGCRH
jgi:hypothetical protein